MRSPSSIMAAAFPVGMHPKYKSPTLELILTKLHSGGKFGDERSYIHSGGLHGVGSSVVNALSQQARRHHQARRLRMDANLQTRQAVPTRSRRSAPIRLHGTTIYFEPDPEIFRVTHFDADWIKTRLDDIAYIHHGLKITFKNEITGESFDLTHPGGIARIPAAARHRKPKAGRQCDRRSMRTRKGTRRSKLTMQWTESTDEIVPLLRQRHPHLRRRHARERPQERHRQGDPQLHGDARRQGQGHRDHRQRHPRRAGRHPVGLHARSGVPGADQGTAQQSGDDRRRRRVRPPGPGNLAQRAT